ncbi:unnamed protein product [Mycena citricolor]|uniref:PLC-like phosphodiesterase n=1 Tax=Mycena citricolor TaxID=2018698 RepID=A0AAD2JWP9_9AGAR|nr:unnamed protein product [Mycena citricolor]CAK5280613.1 unnamed protein product [Mycena citricolor]
MLLKSSGLLQGVLFSLLAAVGSAGTLRRATTCNGHSELCNRSYGNITYIGAHDSYAVGTNNLAVNQDYDITQQLTDGVRMLQSQVHNNSGTIQLCHTSCVSPQSSPAISSPDEFAAGLVQRRNAPRLLDERFRSTLLASCPQAEIASVKTWMDANPNEVVTLLIVNSDNFPASSFASVFAAAGVDKLSYAPTSLPLTYNNWPTLSTLIDAEFTNMWETPFDVTTSFDCSVNRSHVADTATSMYVINHFFDTVVFGSPVPDVADANTTNAVSGTRALGTQAALCQTQYGRPPTFMLVDFYEYGGGSVFQVAAGLNGVTYAPTTPIAVPISTSSSSSTSGSSTTGGSPSDVVVSRAQLGAAVIIASLVAYFM